MKIFITGSSDGLGKLAAIDLINEGHDVVLHARNSSRAEQTKREVPQAERILIGDLSSIEETKKLAADVNAFGEFDAIIHNAGVYRSSRDVIFRVNVLAPYILTSMIKKPKRLIYLSSGLHSGGSSKLNNLEGGISYSDSKLLLVMLTKAVARKWSDVRSNAVNPGWVPTKMGGRGAPDDLQKGVDTQVWLAVSNVAGAKVSGKYFFHKQQVNSNRDADDISKQDQLLEILEEVSGVRFPS